VHSYNKSIFLSLGGVGLLLVGFFWIGLALDFPALENAMVGLTAMRLVGYEVSALLGSDAMDEIVDKVFRTELAFSMVQAFYCILVMGLAFAKGLFRRLKFLALGVGIPLLSLLLLFWVKFLSDDHIISSEEKTELFLLSIFGVSLGVVLCWFGQLPLSRKTRISLDDLELPFEESENKPANDLLEALKERDQGKGGDGTEPEIKEDSNAVQEESVRPAVVDEEAPDATVEDSFPEVAPELPSARPPVVNESESIDEVVESVPLAEEIEDIPLPPLVEEAPDATVEDSFPEALPKSQLAQPAITAKLLPPDLSDKDVQTDVHKSANSPQPDHSSVEVKEEESSPPA